VVLLLTGVAMAGNLDIRFEEALAKATSNGTSQGTGLLAFLVDPTRSLENSHAVQSRLSSLRPPSRFAVRQRNAAAVTVASAAGVAIQGVTTPSLPNLGPAPEFTDNQQWFNTPGDHPLTLSGLRGHVVLVDFLDVHLHQLHPHTAVPEGPLRRPTLDLALTTRAPT